MYLEYVVVTQSYSSEKKKPPNGNKVRFQNFPIFLIKSGGAVLPKAFLIDLQFVVGASSGNVPCVVVNVQKVEPNE